MPSQDGTDHRRSSRRFAMWLLPVAVAVGAITWIAFVRQGGSANTPSRRTTDVVPPPVKEVQVPPQVTEDVWETEEFAEAAGEQLNVLGKLIASPDSISSDALAGIVAPTFSGTRLRPAALETVFETDSIQVRRGSNNLDAEDSAEGTEGFVQLLETLREPLRDASNIHVKFKIYGVDTGDEFITTKVIYQVGGLREKSSIQQSAKWSCRWQQSSQQTPPVLESIHLESFEEVTGQAPTGTLFADCTQAVFRQEPSFEAQILPGIDYWRGAIQAQYGVLPYGHHGIAVGDVNGDGLDDLYACQPSGLPNRLYIQNPDGTVSDTAHAAGVDWLDDSLGTLLLDFDNDGDQDIAVVVNNMIAFMENDGSGHFTERTTLRPTDNAGDIVAADFDLDGDLDVYIVSYGQRFLADGESTGPIPYHDANNGGPNMLLRNDGDWNFVDATEESGLDMNNRRWSFAASWEDYDADGDFDLYVANDYGRNNLYRNDGGTFVDVAAAAGVEDIACGMSVTWGDYDQDGKIDLYVGNMFSSAGLRVTSQARFHANKPNQLRAEFRRHARGNSLFHNEGNGIFRDVSEDADVTIGRWAWGTNFVDVNNDGLEDLVVANGFVTGSDTKDL